MSYPYLHPSKVGRDKRFNNDWQEGSNRYSGRITEEIWHQTDFVTAGVEDEPVGAYPRRILHARI
jgi:hypothetical protein